MELKVQLEVSRNKKFDLIESKAQIMRGLESKNRAKK